MNELSIIQAPDPEHCLEIFTSKNGLDPYLQIIADSVDAVVPDLSTAKGRKEIASAAAKISRSKVALDKAGKELASRLKEQPKLVDAERKRMRDWCDAKRDEIRKPLTDWEDAEKKRVSDLNDRVSEITSYEFMEFSDSTQVKKQLDFISNISVDDTFEELQEAASMKHELAISRLSKKLADFMSLEAAERLAEEKRLQEQQLAQEAREKAIALEAEERAKKQAEEMAEQLKLQEEENRRQQKEASEKRELELKLAKEKAEKEKLEAEERVKQAEAQAQKKLDDQRIASELEAKKREADKNHRARINNSVLAGLVNIGLTEVQSKLVVTAIAKGEIDNISISY